MPTFTVVAGPNGSGKSTLTAAVNFEGRVNLVDPDAIARRINPSNPVLGAATAAREAIIRCREYLASKTSFAIETTLAGKGAIAMMRQGEIGGIPDSIAICGLEQPRTAHPARQIACFTGWA